MRSGIFYYLQADKKNKVNGFRYLQGLFIAGILLMSVSVKAIPTLTYVNGSSQHDTTCANEPLDITSYLSVTDVPGDTVTWTLAYGSPYHGSVSGLPDTTIVSETSMGIPTRMILYTPTTGYSGNDGLIIKATDNLGNTTYTHIHLKINPQPTAVLGANPAVCAGTTTASIPYSGLTNVEADTVSFTTVGDTSWAVPVGVSSLNFDVQGARGGADNATPVPEPGKGGRVQGTLSVTAGQTLHLYVGGEGGAGVDAGTAMGGYNGGGNATFYVYGSGGGGGGGSDIRMGGTALSNRVVVAGGGGGSGYDGSASKPGGAGGNLIGGSSAPDGAGISAGGGTQTSGGAGATYTIWAPGMNGTIDTGGNGSTQGISGGGGGGYYGGGGGVWTGGGGGSSYADTTGGLASALTYTQGYDTGNGQITLTYVIPGTYSIVWDSAALAAGFRDTALVPMPATETGSFALTVPNIVDTLFAVTYSGTLTVNTASCTSPGYPVSITINPIPEVYPNPNQSACNGDSIQAILFTGTSGATFNWAASSTSVGLATSSGTGKIFGFATTNSGSMPSVTTITVTPTENGCTGTPVTFTITDNPIPILGSTSFPAATCDSMPFIYVPSSARDTDVAFTWSRATVPGITNPAQNGTDTIDDTLVNTTDTAIAVVYQYILNYMGCADTQNVTVNIDPHPVLTSSLTPSPICSGTAFNYTPAASDTGTLFAWSRAAVTGISNGAASGTGNPDEILTDTTANPVAVTYVDTLTLSYNTSCSYTQNVTVTVDPVPMLTTPLIAPSTCDTVNYTAMGNTGAGTTFAWSRGVTAGISNAPGSNTSATIYEGLTNTTPYPVVVTYVYTLTALGCSNSQDVTDTIKPTPVLSNPVPVPDSICSNTIFTYTAASATAGTAFAWVRDAITGIGNLPDSAGDADIAEVLINTTAGPIPVTYMYTLTAAGCVNMETVIVTVNPTPALSNAPVDTSVCNNTLLTYNPASNTAGATYTWMVPYVPGIGNFDTSGSGSAGVTLNNTTYLNILDTFEYTITANGCVNTQDIIFAVHPTPVLSSDTAETVCSGSAFIYYPSSYTPATSYAWSVTNVTGITSSSDTGSGYTLIDTLTSSLSGDTDVVFVYTLTAYGCTNTQDVTVLVNPAPAVAGGIITTFAPNTACDNTMYQNFGTSIPPVSGMEYNWVADNAQIYAVGSGNQYCLINFNTPGIATIYLLVNNTVTGCLNNAGYQVTVSNTDNSSPRVIYVNGQFICETTDVESYQWGYDDGTTLDSTLIAGETNQNYFNPQPEPNKYYWVITTSGSCLQKTYYQVPPPTGSTGVVNVNENQDGIKLYPNPAAENINVDIQSVSTGNFRIEVLNIVGQSVNSINTTEHSTKIDVAGLPAGCYMVDCYNDGVKIATAKFIKN